MGASHPSRTPKMSPRFIWELSVTVAAEAEEAVAEFLTRLSDQPVTVSTDVKNRISKVLIYSPSRRRFTKQFMRNVENGLSKVAQCGLDVSPGRIRLRRLRQKNWAETWKKQFKPIRIDSVLLIKPSWSKIKSPKGCISMVLDPGLAFGTGHHPTTAFCLRQIVRLHRTGAKQSFLDIGTGSGILAIAAAKLGYKPVLAFDKDPNAVRVAKANVKRNRLTGSVRVKRADLLNLRLPSGIKFDVVCANLNSELLLECKNQICKLVSQKGALVVAGILKSEFEQVHTAYRKAGFKLVETVCDKEWQSGLFTSIR